MHIVSVAVGSPEFEPWAQQSFPAWFAGMDAGLRADRSDPTTDVKAEVLAGLRVADRPYDTTLITAMDNGTVLGAARTDAPTLDNRHLVQLTLAVPSELRRRGIGTTILREVEDLTRRAGRHSVLTELDRPADRTPGRWPGSGFAAAHGYTLRLPSIRRDLKLPVDEGHLAALEAGAVPHARGYSLRSWQGPTPQADRHHQAGLETRMTTDAPMGDLDYEPEHWDAERIASTETRYLAKGLTWWTAIATTADGTWAGYTQLGWSRHEPDRFYQWATLVLHEHRGHRLGLLFKVAALRAAVRARSEVAKVTTWNAESNAPMIAVNEILGFRPVEWTEDWQRDLG